MPIVSMCFMLALVGFMIWIILQIPMPGVFRNVILGILSVFLILWVLQMLGVNTGFPRVRLQ